MRSLLQLSLSSRFLLIYRPRRKSGDRGWSCLREGNRVGPLPQDGVWEGAVAEPLTSSPLPFPPCALRNMGLLPSKTFLLSPIEEMGTFGGLRGQRWDSL